MFRKTFHSLSFLVMLISFITVNEGYSQTVSGVILDIQNRKPLPGAAIRELGTSRGVSAQEDGSFDITISEEGTQKLLITYLGYKDLEVDVSREHIDLRIFLEPVTYIGNEVFVEATRVGEATPFSFTNVEKEELEKRNLGQDVPFL
ncbi:MAG: carboxypeptidase-like regulatory domain-containing protein, partial [Balneolales bacterium]|nr:carboxypeptidase-like regulatory domain-containing protein [Balneolales bacterium]